MTPRPGPEVDHPPLTHGGCAPSTVPGWWLDLPAGFVAGCPRFAARAAEVVRAGATARHATVVLARDDAQARRALAALGRLDVRGDGDGALEVVLVRVQGAEALALVLPPEVAVPPPPPPPAPPPTAAAASPVSSSTVTVEKDTNLAVGVRRRRARAGALASVAALPVLVGALLTGWRAVAHDTEPPADPPDASPVGEVEWDAERAIATVTVAGRTQHFAIGAPGDQLVTGDWDGDGARTPALYRTATGEVWEFDRWAHDGHPVPARLLHTLPAGGIVRVVRTEHHDRPELLAPTG